MTELLIIGGGMLAFEVALASASVLDTVLTYHSSPLKVDGVETLRLDVTGDLSLIRSKSPRYILLAAALSDVDLCQKNFELAWDVNVNGAKRVAKAAFDVGSKLIYISTDYVFDGCTGMYDELDVPSPINLYGRSKLEGERVVQSISQDNLVVRTSTLYGWSPVRRNFSTWMQDNMSKGQRIMVADDQYTSPTYLPNLAKMLLDVLDCSGVIHLAGSNRVSRYDFALELASAFGHPKDLIDPVPSSMIKWHAPRPADSSLDVSKVSGLKGVTRPAGVRRGLMQMAQVRTVAGMAGIMEGMARRDNVDSDVGTGANCER